MIFQIYSKDHCPSCFKAISIINKYGLDFQEFKLGKEFTREELLEQFPNAKTFPQIQIKHENGKITYIGGVDDLERFLNQ